MGQLQTSDDSSVQILGPDGKSIPSKKSVSRKRISKTGIVLLAIPLLAAIIAGLFSILDSFLNRKHENSLVEKKAEFEIVYVFVPMREPDSQELTRLPNGYGQYSLISLADLEVSFDYDATYSLEEACDGECPEETTFGVVYLAVKNIGTQSARNLSIESWLSPDVSNQKIYLALRQREEPLETITLPNLGQEEGILIPLGPSIRVGAKKPHQAIGPLRGVAEIQFVGSDQDANVQVVKVNSPADATKIINGEVSIEIGG